jgi:hypothetical protein
MKALAAQEGIGTVVVVGELASSLDLDADGAAIELKRLMDARYVD